MKRVALLALMFAAPSALAHSEKESTVPADGATLSAPPETIRMVFDDPMRITMVRLSDGSGAEMPMTRATGAEPSLEFRATPDPLPPGRYTVDWRGLASDGHPMQGRFTFEIAD